MHPRREFERIEIDGGQLVSMLERIKTRSWLVATSVTIVVFVAISALALPTLETSLTFIPILGVSVFAGAISGFIVRKRARSGSR